MKAFFKINETPEGHTFSVKYNPAPEGLKKLQGAKLLILESILDEFYHAAETKAEEQLISDFMDWLEEKKKILEVK